MSSARKIVPLAAIPHSVEQHLSRTTRPTRIIYLTILFTVFTCFILLFVIHTDVTVKSGGTIKSLTERNEIRTGTDGVIDSLYVQENSVVKAGQPLMKIRSAALEQKNAALAQQYKELEAQVNDLRFLTTGRYDSLSSAIYQQQYRYYLQRLAEVNNRVSLAVKNFDRFAYLYQHKAVSALEYDKASFEKSSAQSEAALIKQQQQSLWQTELTNLNNQLQQLSAQLGINEEYVAQYEIKAQIDGTVQGLKGVQPGNVVGSGEVIGEISPEGGLLAEAYVLPKDIALIRTGQKVKMQVEAFNYHEWGDVEGVVESISPDVFTTEGQPYFKVRCRLDKTQLQLNNGYAGQLKKGMTIQARFKIARRSLFQLLSDKVEDWLNPNDVTNGPTAKK